MITSIGNKIAPLEANQEDMNILRGVLAASNDACWCMEFGMPVDLTAPDHEVVRQVFENDPFWRLSNPAMAQLYLLPVGRKFNDQPVSDIFPRNQQNEEFVRNLIANGFEADRAPALDTRYDGAQIYVENDVRAHIEDGQLIRMFGTVRDVGKHQLREAELQHQLNFHVQALNVMPMPFLAVNENGTIKVANRKAIDYFDAIETSLNERNIFDLSARVVNEVFASELRDCLTSALSGGIPTTKSVRSVMPESLWQLSVNSSAHPIAATISINDPVLGDQND